MRFLKASVVLTAVIVLLCSPKRIDAAPDLPISGRLIFEDVDFTCDQQCTITLLAVGVRPVQTVIADLGGHFIFNPVPRGQYSIRVDIQGFEPITQPLDSLDSSRDVNVLMTLVRKTKQTSSAEPNVVNVAEFQERYPKKAVSYFEKGTNLLRKKKNDEAVKQLKSAVDLAPTFYEAHNQLGIAYREAGRIADAEREFLLAHELNSTNVEPLLNLTTLYLDENEPDRAVTTGEQAVKANSSSAPAFFSLGIALYKAAQLDRAEVALKRALDLAPKMSNIRLVLANVYLKLRRYDRTLDELDTYIAENPKGEQVKEAQQMRERLAAALSSQRP
jgi:tetratricopeptide (TPR) repeat protein